MTKSKKDKSIDVPWRDAAMGEDQLFENCVSTLVHNVNPLNKEKKKQKEEETPEKKKQKTRKLSRDFQNSAQSQGIAHRAMLYLAKAMDVYDAHSSVKKVPLKDWQRAYEKMDTERNLNDLGRGRIRIRSPKAVFKFYQMIKTLDKEGRSKEMFGTDKIRIIPDPKTGKLFDNYLNKKRGSGYAAAIHFDIEIDLPNQQKGRYETQIMPASYEMVDAHSHYLFDMIRELEEMPKNWKTEAHNSVLNILKESNGAMFDEEAITSGFSEIRGLDFENSIKPRKMPKHQQKLFSKLSTEEYEEHLDVLDYLQEKVTENVEKTLDDNPSLKEDDFIRLMEWKQNTLRAMTYAKTSLTNLQRAKNKVAPYVKRDGIGNTNSL